MSRFTASFGTIFLGNLRLLIFGIISKYESQTDLRSSSQLRPLLTSVCKLIFIAAITGVIFSVKSKISAIFETQFCLVNLDGMMFWCSTVFFPCCFLAKFNSAMSRANRSFLGNQFIPATLTAHCYLLLTEHLVGHL